MPWPTRPVRVRATYLMSPSLFRCMDERPCNGDRAEARPIFRNFFGVGYIEGCSILCILGACAPSPRSYKINVAEEWPIPPVGSRRIYREESF